VQQGVFRRMRRNMAECLSAKLEDYIESIYRIEREKRVARPRDICRDRNVAGSTVTAALQSLAEKGLINYQPYEVITLTGEGRQRAERLLVRRRIIRDFLRDVLGLEQRKAAETACSMEHAVDTETLQRFVCFLAFLRRCSRDGAKWLAEFRRFLDETVDGRSCEECIKEYMESGQDDAAG